MQIDLVNNVSWGLLFQITNVLNQSLIVKFIYKIKFVNNVNKIMFFKIILVFFKY